MSNYNYVAEQRQLRNQYQRYKAKILIANSVSTYALRQKWETQLQQQSQHQFQKRLYNTFCKASDSEE